MSEDTRQAVLQRLDGNKKKTAVKKKSWKFDLKQGLDNLSNYVNGNKKKPVKKPISGKKSPVKHLTPMPRRSVGDDRVHAQPYKGDGKKHLLPMPRPSEGDGKKHLLPMPRPSGEPVSRKKAPIKKKMYNGPLNDAIKAAAAKRIAKGTTTENSVRWDIDK